MTRQVAVRRDDMVMLDESPAILLSKVAAAQLKTTK